jgi:hypothetical protein
MFAASAAIAMKNATMLTLPTYGALFGNNLSNQLEELKLSSEEKDSEKLSLNMLIYHELHDLFRKLQIARGIDEISLYISDEVSKLCTILALPDKFSSVFSKFQKHEGVLYALPNYRDHFIHMFHVFTLGYLILNSLWKNGISISEENDENKKTALLKSWFLASIQHDIAYPIQMAEFWFPRFPKDALDLDVKIRGNFDWTPILLAEKNEENIEMMTEKFLQPLLGKLNEKASREMRIKFREWVNKQLLEKHDHGALSSLSLLNFEWAGSDVKYAQDAAITVLLHNYCKDKKTPFGQLEFSTYPLPFLLTFCDAVQEWGRAQTNPKGMQKSVDSSKKFKTLEIGLDKKITVVLSYNKKDQQRKKFDTSLKNAIVCINDAWSCVKTTHHFSIRVVDENGENPHELPVF